MLIISIISCSISLICVVLLFVLMINSKQDFANSRTETSNLTKTLDEKVTKLTTNTDDKLNKLVDVVNNSLRYIQQENSKQLEEMRKTVDERLQKTLQSRLDESFVKVQQQLESVQKGLGEMQVLATNVGDLKKTLTNVKTRGIMGEIQLESILEQILSPEQYEKNVNTNPNTQDKVEFAIKLPDALIPIDAKFPMECFIRLQEAYESGDIVHIEAFRKELEAAIKKSAKDISSKYIFPPVTTDFAIMFLPTEGLYAEVANRVGLIEQLQRDNKIIISGPTTFAAILNSLQMGFRTLSIQQRSAEVWKTLASVKREFETFGSVLSKTQEKLSQAGSELDKLVGTRTNMIIRQLKNIDEVPILEEA